MEEMWSGDRAVLVKVVEIHESTGEYLKSEQVLEAFPDGRHDAVQHSLRRLGTHGYIDTVTAGPTLGDSRVEVLAIKGVTEKAPCRAFSDSSGWLSS